MKNYILSIDQGTTSTRVIIFDKNLILYPLVKKNLNKSFQEMVKLNMIQKKYIYLFCLQLKMLFVGLKSNQLK